MWPLVTSRSGRGRGMSEAVGRQSSSVAGKRPLVHSPCGGNSRAFRSGSSRLVAAAIPAVEAGAHIRSRWLGIVTLDQKTGSEIRRPPSTVQNFWLSSGNVRLHLGQRFIEDLSCCLQLSDQRDRAFESFCSISLLPGSSSSARW